MARTLNLTCRQCRKTLWVGQFETGEDDCFLYTTDRHLNDWDRFVNSHLDHDVRFENSDSVPENCEDVTR